MLSHELRAKYLKFFEGKGHLIHASDSLVPNDPTLYFTSAGMVQFKPYFVGDQQPPSRRIATSQKCLRTDDIDEVGDAVHHTFFEMLGNFSFGDYFKRESIIWAWEFITEVLKLDPDHIWTSVYLDDDEAADVWAKEIGFPSHRLVRLGEDKNYWPANAPSQGPNGVCGPCNEIFVDISPDLGRPADPAHAIAHEGNRFVEIWNLVFTQFDRQEDGTLVPLPAKNIDTGMGLERTAAILQGTPTDYETDLFLPLVQRIESVSGAKYGSDEKTDFAIRVVADHIRAATFAIADGVMPSNIKRGYVLRRIIRNAIVKGRKLGLKRDFLTPMVAGVVDLMGDVYPEIADRRGYIEKVISSEEEKFRHTLESGLQRLEDQVEIALASSGRQLDGGAAFTLYDTYGFPLEITREIAAEKGITVDQAGFDAAMEEQRARAKEASDFGAVMMAGEGSVLLELERTAGPTRFLGYQATLAEATVLAIVKDGELATTAGEGDQVDLVLDQTPFYAESGGQVGDTGRITSLPLQGRVGDGSSVMNVTDTVKLSRFSFHRGTVTAGSISVGDSVQAQVEAGRRSAIMRSHTATHLLHAALHNVLGEHALQSGSVVEPDRLRFDFSHFQAVSPDEVRRIENQVNEWVLADIGADVVETGIDEARQMGATALFGEKYGDSVRVVRIGDISMELCGGTHLVNTGRVGSFKIISESSIGAGLRRIEAVTGMGVVGHVHALEDQLKSIADVLGVGPSEAATAAQRALDAVREARREIDQLKSKSAAESAGDLADSAQEAGGVKFVTASAPTADVATLQKMADSISDKLKSGVVVLAGVADGKVLFISKVTSDLVPKGFHAGNLLREVAKVAGGGGGGKPEFAQAGGRDASKAPDALAKAEEMIRSQAGA